MGPAAPHAEGPASALGLEARRVALREVQLGLDHRRRRQPPRQHPITCGRAQPGAGAPIQALWTPAVQAAAPALGRMRVHVVVDVFLHFRLGREPSSAVRHGAAEWPVPLVRPRVLVQDRLLPEVFPALRALVGLLPRMDA